MKTFNPPDSSIHFIARGFIQRGENIILCKVKGKDWFFLPGGHVENEESSKDALIRELTEEIGGAQFSNVEFIGVCENIFSEKDNVFQHEVNMVFTVKVPDDFVIVTNEDHIEFVSIPKESFSECKLLPEVMKDSLERWISDQKIFFVGL